MKLWKRRMICYLRIAYLSLRLCRCRVLIAFSDAGNWVLRLLGCTADEDGRA